MPKTWSTISAFCSLALMVCVSPTFAQFRYDFENLSTDRGLSNGSVNAIGQDSTGFLWIATNAGLDRFDGYEFKHFLDHSVRSFYIDGSGHIYVVSDRGVEMFDPTTERVISYLKQTDSLQISRQMIRAVEDNTGNLWISSIQFHENKGGLTRLNKRNGSFQKFDDGTMQDTGPLLVDEFGNIWAGARGISILNPNTQEFVRHFEADPKTPNALGGNAIYALYREKNGVIWAGTDKGISRISYSKDYIIRIESFAHTTTNPNSLVDNNTSCIMKDSKGNLWISTTGGISRFDLRRHEFTNFIASHDNAHALKESQATVLFEDRNENIWIGHGNLGLSRIKKNKGFIQLSVEPERTEKISGNNFTHVYSDKNGSILAGIADHGLHEINFKGDYTHYPKIKIHPSPLRWVSAIVRDRKENLWMAGWPNGELYRQPPGTAAPANAMNFQNVVSLLEDGEKNVLILDQTNGLFISRNRPGKRPAFVKLLPDPQRKSKNLVLNFSDLTIDTRHRVWVSDWEGDLFCYDSRLGRAYQPDIKTSLPPDNLSSQISTFKISGDSSLWVGTLQGLHKYRIRNDTAGMASLTLEKVYAEREGLIRDEKPNLYTAALEEDLHGNIWLAQNSGLYQLNPKTNTLKLYTPGDGLPGNTFAIRGSCQLPGGFLAFSSTNGLAIFHPDSLKENKTPPKVVLTELRLSNQLVSIASDRSQQKVFHLAQAAPYTRELEIPYGENVLGFEFAALDFTEPGKNQYAYRMEGFDKDWVYSGTRRSATYTNLSPGTYTFLVKGSNNDGVWSSSGAKIRITILPPPWKTWWAYSLYVAACAAMLFLGRNEAVKRERLRNQVKLKELEAARYHELDALKSRFFTNISHEFRTPLTLILAPIQKRLDRSVDEGDRAELSVIQRNASQLLSLVNQLLDLAQLEAGTLKMKYTQGDLREFFITVASQFYSIADSKRILFTVVGEDGVSLNFDADKLNKIVTNLLSNAFKFTPEGGTIDVHIKQSKANLRFKDGYAEITVSDTGPGIAPEHIEKIFDRFYQVDDTATRPYGGSGIGLALARELVVMHEGQITINSFPGKGSTFTVQLPLKGGESAAALYVASTELTARPGYSAILREDSPTTEGPRILIVEDNADLRGYLRENMKQHFSVLEASDGESGIATALRELPDLVISDLMMPGISGLQLCSRLKEDEKTSHIPIILLTAKVELDAKIEGLRIGADDYVGKPFDFRELEARVRNLIEIRRKLRPKALKQLALKPKEIVVDSIDDRFIKKIAEIVESRMSDPSFDVDQLALDAAMSNVQLYRKLKALTGHGPNDLIRNFRLERAASLLRQHAGTVAEVAYQTGFNSLSYFSKCFKDKFGVPPSEY